MLIHLPQPRRQPVIGSGGGAARYRVAHAGAIWDVDVFGGALDGLILAEIEMAHEDQSVTLPYWAGQEVTADARYRNSRLAAGTMTDRLAARSASRSGT